MKRWLKVSSGVVVDAVNQETQPAINGTWVEAQGAFGPGDTFINGVFAKANSPRLITKRSLWNRFPAANEVAMRAVIAQGSPVVLAASLQRLEKRVDAVGMVDLDLQETKDAIAWLSSPGVPETIDADGQLLPLRLTPQQAAAILNTTPRADEV